MNSTKEAKNELILNDFKTTGKKCGEIFIFTENKLIFHCNLCENMKFMDFNTFCEHLVLIHSIGESIKIEADIFDEGNSLISPIDPEIGLCKSENINFDETNCKNFEDQDDQDDGNLSFVIFEKDCTVLKLEKTKECQVRSRKRKKNDDIQIQKPKRVGNWNRVYKTFIVDGATRYQCEICDKHFNTRSNLRAHERIHKSDWKEHPCQHCDKICKTARLLRDHTRIHTGERPYKCDICGKDSPTKSALLNHKIIHSDKKRFECDYCDARFHAKGHKVIHERTHTGEKPFVCDNCGDRFASITGLIDHKKTHMPDAPKKYSCNICLASFHKNPSLKRHMLVHSDERNFVCNICSAAYKGKKELVQHQKIHLGTNEYRCKICRLEFARYSRVRDHIRFKHGTDVNIRSNVIYTPANEAEPKNNPKKKS